MRDIFGKLKRCMWYLGILYFARKIGSYSSEKKDMYA